MLSLVDKIQTSEVCLCRSPGFWKLELIKMRTVVSICGMKARDWNSVQSPIKWETWSTLCVTTHVHLYTAASTPGKRTRNKSPRSSFLRLIIVLQQEQTHVHSLSGWFCNQVHRWFPTKTHWKKHTHAHLSLPVFPSSAIVWQGVESQP